MQCASKVLLYKSLATEAHQTVPRSPAGVAVLASADLGTISALPVAGIGMELVSRSPFRSHNYLDT